MLRHWTSQTLKAVWRERKLTFYWPAMCLNLEESKQGSHSTDNKVYLTFTVVFPAWIHVVFRGNARILHPDSSLFNWFLVWTNWDFRNRTTEHAYIKTRSRATDMKTKKRCVKVKSLCLNLKLKGCIKEGGKIRWNWRLLLTATHSFKSSPSGNMTAMRRFPLPSVASACFNSSYWCEPSGIFFLGLNVLDERFPLWVTFQRGKQTCVINKEVVT